MSTASYITGVWGSTRLGLRDDDDGAGGGDAVAPAVESSGADSASLDISACSGELLLHSKQCTFDACTVLQDVINLKTKLNFEL
jgi:hypothetical protein